MTEHYKQSSFKKLLEKLQEESWQLELIISGFAIYGLFMAYDPISLSAKEAQNNDQIYTFVVSMVAMVSCAILIFNLLLHVILRGLWIGALGLRYVSGDIDYERLRYSRKFTSYLKRRVGSFDRYTANLENYCSVIFAISFLLIFYVLAITLIIIAVALLGNYVIGNDDLPRWISQGIGIPLMFFLVFGMLFTFFDFITQGWLKKKQWISRIYFPVYWVFHILTLSFLYRPLVYNFLDNKFGKRLSFMLLPIYVVILVLTSINYNRSNYLDEGSSSSEIYANSQNYEDMLADQEDVFIKNVAIPSKVIRDPYLKVFIVFNQNIENRVFNFNESLRPEEDKRGLRSDIRFNNDGISFRKRDSITKTYLNTFNTIYYTQIDSLEYDSNFILGQSLKEELGFETYLDIHDLQAGRHTLRVHRKYIDEGDTLQRNVATIPFWYFED
ncbi:MAG: hypothetical protein KJO25_03990 [Bacteroidia bacterium]|nr:hypothetical protein [Bacteroidia bacterium]